MNWKVTKIKSVASFGIAILISLVGNASTFCTEGIPRRCTTIAGSIPWYVMFVISLVLVYSIWSLIQKKESVVPISTNENKNE